MRQKPGIPRVTSEQVVKDICRATRKQYSAEEKIHIVLNEVALAHTMGWRPLSYDSDQPLGTD